MSEQDESSYMRLVERTPNGGVRIRCFARVHTGAIDLSSSPARGGGFGFGIPGLGFDVVTRFRDLNQSGTVENYLPRDDIEKFGERLGIPLHKVDWDVHGTVLRHKGFGSTTQIHIAALQGASLLTNGRLFTPVGLSLSGIGAQSSVGLRSAFGPEPVVDFGADAHADNRLYEVRPAMKRCLRLTFPDDWFLLAVWPLKDQGVTGADEDALWDSCLPLPPGAVGDVAAGILVNILPGILNDDIQLYNQGIEQLNCSGAKKIEWSLQPKTVHRARSTLLGAGLHPLLTSVGPGLVAVDKDHVALRAALKKLKAAHWSGQISLLNDSKQVLESRNSVFAILTEP